MNAYDADRLLRQLHLHRNPAMVSYTVVDNTVTCAITHTPYFQPDWTVISDMTLIFEEVIEFSDSNSDPVIPVETLIGFDERQSDDGVSIYYFLTDERELTLITKKPFQVIDLSIDK